MSPTASLVYWYDRDQMPLDGGGLRAQAWFDALQSLGFNVRFHAIHPGPLPQTHVISPLTRVKRVIAPMPLSRKLDLSKARNDDIVIVTVPAGFVSAARQIERSKLVFDWMDLWSVNARNMGANTVLSTPGGAVQGAIWKARERRLPALAAHNTYAGYADSSQTQTSKDSERGIWLPTPVELPPRAARENGPRISRLGFIGNLNYAPNEMSLRSFLRAYGAPLHDAGYEIVVAGFGTERVSSWGYPVTVLGAVESVSTFYDQIDAVIVPIEHGGGIKVKAVEAIAYGKPVFASDHVRSGFSRDYATILRPLSELLSVKPDDLVTVATNIERVSLASRFSQTRFVEDVGALVALQ